MPVLIQPEDKTGLQSLEGIPLIDFSDFGDGSTDASRRIAQEFYTACRDVGFAYILGLGIESQRVQDMFGWVCTCSNAPVAQLICRAVQEAL